MKGYIFDLDGTVYLDDEPIDGAAKTINKLKAQGHKVVFLTNKSIARRSDYVEKLNKMGIHCTIDDVINSNFITAKFFQGKPGKAFVIGEKPLFKELTEEGILITNNPREADYVVIGWDREFNYEKLSQAYEAYQNGAKIIATNPDRTCPTKEGEIPDCGAMIGAIEGATGKAIDYIAGKPSSLMMQHVIEEVLALPPSQCYMIGDRLETDILMGNENGVNSVLVLTGITKRADVAQSEIKPTYILNSIADLKSSD